MSAPLHHEIRIERDGVTWRCSCSVHGRALNPDSTRAWSSDHVFRRGETKSIVDGSRR